MPTSMPRCLARRWRCSPTRARSAAPAPGCTCSGRSTTSSCSAWRRSRRRCVWAMRSIPRPSSGRSFRPRSSTASSATWRSEKSRAHAPRPAVRIADGALARLFRPDRVADVRDDMRIAREGDLRPGHPALPFRRRRRRDPAATLRPGRRRLTRDLNTAHRVARASHRLSGQLLPGDGPGRCRSAATRWWVRAESGTEHAGVPETSGVDQTLALKADGFR